MAPTRTHELPIDLVQHRPEMAPVLLERAAPDVPIPGYCEVALECSDLAELDPVPYAADAVVVLRDVAGEPVAGIVVEVQLAFKDDKLYSWPVYQANLRTRLRCPVEVVVICPDLGCARKYAAPIHTDLSRSVMWPKVVGPDRVPVVTDVARAEELPELAVLSALTHEDEPGVLEAFAHALGCVDGQRGAFYYDYVVGALSEAARKHWEALMATDTYEWRTDFAREHIARGEAKGEARGEARGEAKGEAKAVLGVLEARGLAVPEAARERILTCDDMDQLDRWVGKVATVTTVEELFGESPGAHQR